MTVRRRVFAAVAASLVALAATLPLASPSAAQTGPSVILDRLQVRSGETLIVSLRGFESNYVTLTFCGNLAKRGSADCDMKGSKTDNIRTTLGVTLTEFVVSPPPVPCPCIIRASSTTQGEFGVASVGLIGHPVAPVVDAVPGHLVEVVVEAEHAPAGLVGWARSLLGGPARYEVDVSVRNVTTDTLSNVVLTGSARHRYDDDAGRLRFPAVPPLDPGQTWSHAQSTVVHAPSLGRYAWSISAVGAGPTVTGRQVFNRVPIVLVVLVVVLAADLGVLLWRRRHRRPERTSSHRRRTAVVRRAGYSSNRS